MSIPMDFIKQSEEKKADIPFLYVQNMMVNFIFHPG